MTHQLIQPLIWAAGAIHVGIIATNFALPARLKVREHLAPVPTFIRQIFYVHWVYIVIVLGLFAALCFAFAPDLAGATRLGRFLSAFMAAFWFLRIVLQIVYYDPQVRRENRILDSMYVGCLVLLVAIFSMAALS